MTLCYFCGKAELNTEILEVCPNCDISYYPTSKEKVPNTEIHKLIQLYEAELCNFSDIKGTANIAMRYAEEMGDSHVRCILYTLAKYIQDNGR